MNCSFLLAILLLPAFSAFAAEATAPELLKLERRLTEKKEAKEKGSVSEEEYRLFLDQFRFEFKESSAKVLPSSENIATKARILVLLGETGEAVASINRALDERPDDATLRLSLGRTQLESKDYAAALAAAEEVLKRDPTNLNALFLKHESSGRIAGTSSNAGNWFPSPAPGPQAAASNSRPIVAYSPETKRGARAAEVPGIAADAPASKDGKPLPIWPLALPVSAALIGYGVVRSKSTLSQEEDVGHAVRIDPEDDARWKRHAKAVVLSVAVGVGVVYGGPLAWRVAVPLVTTIWRGGTLPVQRIAASPTVENLNARVSGVGPQLNTAAQTLTKAAPQAAQELKSALAGGERIRNLLMPGGRLIGRNGSSPDIRIIEGTMRDAEAMLAKLTQGVRVVPHPGRGIAGKFAQLSDGSHVGLRYVSKSGPPTINVNVLGREMKIKYLLP